MWRENSCIRMYLFNEDSRKKPIHKSLSNLIFHILSKLLVEVIIWTNAGIKLTKSFKYIVMKHLLERIYQLITLWVYVYAMIPKPFNDSDSFWHNIPSCQLARIWIRIDTKMTKRKPTSWQHWLNFQIDAYWNLRLIVNKIKA